MLFDRGSEPRWGAYSVLLVLDHPDEYERTASRQGMGMEREDEETKGRERKEEGHGLAPSEKKN